MFGITINGRDFSDRLLREDGFNSLNRAAIEPDTFTPVGDTMSVRLSDLDGTVASFLGVPDIGQFAEIAQFSVIATDDADVFFDGYIAERSARKAYLDADDPDSEKIVEFSLIDRTIWLFSDLSKKTPGPISTSSGTPVHIEGTSGMVHIITLQEAIAFELRTTNRVTLDSGLAELILVREFLADIIGGGPSPETRPGYRRSGANVITIDHAYSRADFIQDLAALFVAHPYVDGDTFHFKAAKYIGTGFDEIAIFTSLSLEPSDRRSISYIQDRAMEGGPGFPFKDVWYSGSGGPTFTKPTEQNGIVSIEPSVGTSDLLHNLVIYRATNGLYYNRNWESSTEKIRRIFDMLKPSVFVRVRTTGVQHRVNTPVRLGGVPGYRIVEANIEPMSDEAELTLEYRKP